jgi:hypothetical protein
MSPVLDAALAQAICSEKCLILCLSPFILTEVWRTLHVSRLKKKYHYSDTELTQYELGIKPHVWISRVQKI